MTHVVDGVVGPRGDGYVIGEVMSASEAAVYHGLQARAFAEAGAAMTTGVTMTYVDEAVGVARAAHSVGLPVVISFTVETDGALPSGDALGEAIARVDDATDGTPAYYMVKCAHPAPFAEQLTPGAEWLTRVTAIRAKTSRCSHAELDVATEPTVATWPRRGPGSAGWSSARTVHSRPWRVGIAWVYAPSAGSTVGRRMGRRDARTEDPPLGWQRVATGDGPPQWLSANVRTGPSASSGELPATREPCTARAR